MSSRVERALAVYAAHRWNATSRLCACGDFFEATLKGNQQHKEHRMTAVIVAIEETEENPTDTCKECGAGLMVNTLKIASMEVFCPNDQCPQFAQSLWVDRGCGCDFPLTGTHSVLCIALRSKG